MTKNKLPEAVRDGLVLTGAGSIVIGIGMVSVPFALIAGGLATAGLAVLWQLDIEHKKADAERDRRRGL